jgi:1-acyl-sn-glycerol-3-phosphate acyltransferase
VWFSDPVQRLRSILSASGKAGWMFYLFIRTSIRVVLFRYFRVRVIGREHLETSGPLIIAPSHRSNLDAPLTGGVLDFRPHSLSKESLFENPILAWIITALGSFPVKRGTADREAMRAAEKMLSDGESLLVFPEGTRQSGAEIGEIYDGTAYLAARGGAAVIPLGISGTEGALPPGAKFPRRSTVTVVIGPPISPPSSEGRVRRKDLGAFTDQLSAGLQAALDEANRDAASR